MTPYYDCDGIVIYHGDSRDLWREMTFDAVLTDPPYGVSGEQNTKTAVLRGFRKNDYSAFTDSVEYVTSVAVPVVAAIVKTGTRVVLTPGNRCLTLYPPPDSFGAIFQPASVGLQPWGRADAQPILYYGKSPYGGKQLPGQKCSFTLTESAEVNGHPCPKPLGFWKLLLETVSVPGETVLDPFCGSGTTMRAAKDLGRKAIGIEIEERYCEIAAKRMAQRVLFA